jgi:transposase
MIPALVPVPHHHALPHQPDKLTERRSPDRSGDHQLNQALYTVVLTRLRTDPVTRAYATRRRAQGKTNREIKRCLIRYVARQLYRLLETQPALDAT